MLLNEKSREELWAIIKDMGLDSDYKYTELSKDDMLKVLSENMTPVPDEVDIIVPAPLCDGECEPAAHKHLRWDKGQVWYFNSHPVRYCPYCGRSLKITEV